MNDLELLSIVNVASRTCFNPAKDQMPCMIHSIGKVAFRVVKEVHSQVDFDCCFISN